MTSSTEAPRAWTATPPFPLELGDRRVLAPGRLRWLRALGWMLLLFVIFAGLSGATGYPLVDLYQDRGTDPLDVLWILLACLGSLAIYAVIVWFGEARAPSELALKPAVPETVLGLLIGAGLIALVVAAMALLGAYRLTGPTLDPPWAAMGIGIQPGIMEELLLRAIMLRLLARAFGVWWGLALSSAIFGALHLANPDADWFSSLCIAIEAGILLGSFYVATGRLWLSIGVHAGWNFAQGYVFGSDVSGFADTVRLWNGSPVPGAPTWLSGGGFGPEATLPALLIGTGVGLWVLWWGLARARRPAEPRPTGAG